MRFSQTTASALYQSTIIVLLISIADYSVLVENVPGNATKVSEWIEFFKSLAPLEEHGGKVADVTIAMNNGKLQVEKLGNFL